MARHFTYIICSRTRHGSRKPRPFSHGQVHIGERTLITFDTPEEANEKASSIHKEHCNHDEQHKYVETDHRALKRFFCDELHVHGSHSEKFEIWVEMVILEDNAADLDPFEIREFV